MEGNHNYSKFISAENLSNAYYMCLSLIDYKKYVTKGEIAMYCIHDCLGPMIVLFDANKKINFDVHKKPFCKLHARCQYGILGYTTLDGER